MDVPCVHKVCNTLRWNHQNCIKHYYKLLFQIILSKQECVTMSVLTANKAQHLYSYIISIKRPAHLLLITVGLTYLNARINVRSAKIQIFAKSFSWWCGSF